jgi:hypothetical protein
MVGVHHGKDFGTRHKLVEDDQLGIVANVGFAK